ncbi:hypothetical protein H5410_014783 [Solanum commersonii]|uniref:Uncharacterized protein n=1 Tax=Solanum commersonii TaxID=4109 RepID=A0A9J5ZSH5_SOLCO|nr:hypothetical protein H5410_014783 [Solanum commersonii]
MSRMKILQDLLPISWNCKPSNLQSSRTIFKWIFIVFKNLCCEGPLGVLLPLASLRFESLGDMVLLRGIVRRRVDCSLSSPT